MVDPQRFIRELKQRRVFRVAVVYAVVAWALIQVSDTVFPRLELPDWLITAVIIFALLGFPIAIILAWAFEVTPEGVRRTEPMVGSAGESGPVRAGGMGRASGYVGLGILVALVGFGAHAYMGAPEGRADRSAMDVLSERSIAALPFANMSASEENAYFASGIHENVLTELALIGDLAVVSRTSVLQYAGTEKTIPQIGRELGVAYILEGSVQRAGERVRITAQLIDARTDQHVWADSYDRTIDDIFALQSEVAKQIAAAMDATLTPEEEGRIGRQPTQNMAAYQLYLRARELPALVPEKNEMAIELLKQAIELDPAFADAYAGLAGHYMQRVQTHGWPIEWADSGVAMAREALALEPELARGYSSLGSNLSQLGRFRESIAAYRRAIEINPNYTTPLNNLAVTERIIGRLDTAIQWAHRGHRLDPTSAYLPVQIAAIEIGLRRYDQAEHWVQKALEIDSQFLWAHVVQIILDEVRGRDDAAWAGAQRLLEAAGDNVTARSMAAEIALWTGRIDEARRHFEVVVRRAPGGRNPANPTHSFRLGLAFTLLQTGEEQRANTLLDAALADAEQAIEAGNELPDIRVEIALIHGLRGQTERALDWIERAYDVGWRDMSYSQLDPLFDPLRDHPRFRSVVERIGQDLAEQRARVTAAGEDGSLAS